MRLGIVIGLPVGLTSYSAWIYFPALCSDSRLFSTMSSACCLDWPLPISYILSMPVAWVDNLPVY